jgi:phosphatidylglycerophosphate synthase
MRKVDREYDNPIENIILDVGDKLLPYFKNTGHTPNTLTTYSFILGIAAVYFLYKDELFIFAICFYASFIFDCWDGYMARTYNMTSPFGDLYDHITDVTVGLGLAYVAYTKYKNQITFPLVLLIGIMTLFMQTHVACYQKFYLETNKKEKETIDAIAGLCVDKNDIKWTRYFGPATYTLFIIGLMYYLNRNSN